MSIAAQSGNPGKEYYHLERTRKAHAYVPPAALKNYSVNEMVEKGLISTCRQEECMTVYQRANSEEVDCVFPIFWGEHSLSDRYIFFSVYTGEKDSWNASNEDIEDIEEMVSGNLGMPYQPEYTHSSLITMTNYLWNFKRIPEDLPPDLTKTEKPVPENFEPTEKNCPYYPGPCPPELNNAFVLTTQATVYGIFSQNKGISVYGKECPVCRNIVRFQEYNSGFHNYNNGVFLSIPLCSFLTTGLSNHIAIGRMLRTIESHSGTKLTYNSLRKAFYHFSALRKYSYNYFCYRCGHHPSVVIADTNWKVAFELPVHLLKHPEKHNITPQETEVNVAGRWENLEKEIVATGLCDGLSYSDRASTSRVAKEIDEDHILQVLDSKSPKKDELTKACNVLGVSASGSIADMINRLEELLLYKHVYPKMFVKLKKAGGGVLHMGCTHGVVYYASPLWWQESARDHGDALLSFKHPPTVYICDIAGCVASHVNNRTHQQFFQPHDGRVCEPTEANISLASAGKLRVNLDWVDNIKKKTKLNLEHSTTEQFSQPHPETGTTDRFSLYDRFHQKNQKRPEEKLRSLKAIPELASLINTAEAEQVNRELSSSRYSLCQMKDTQYMFSLRLYFHLHNARKNSAVKL
ncbi:hypothetical protein DPX16_8179 [Anabarilius grahami]|uniref:HMG domain-containing protein n=1 Tax=Anabarilius grahami TaxID=495550 RepID=A0A3N0Y963_ANAGA|nr:hypothetical protein DPX16_8179 [Anabarilius grahami]